MSKINFYDRFNAPPGVTFYEDGSRITHVRFRTKLEAWLFHLLLNRSIHHAGVRNY